MFLFDQFKRREKTSKREFASLARPNDVNLILPAMDDSLRYLAKIGCTFCLVVVNPSGKTRVLTNTHVGKAPEEIRAFASLVEAQERAHEGN